MRQVASNGLFPHAITSFVMLSVILEMVEVETLKL